MRVTLYTDTLGDVSGVCRFIQDMARIALETGRDLTVVTSTAKAIPETPNLVNFPPIVARRMPRYPDLDIVAPPVVAMLQHAMARRADVVHTSTPGPVGLVGRMAAPLSSAPVCGVYHTDFPAYLQELYQSQFMGWATAQTMRAFYAGVRKVFSRSEEYVRALEGIGVGRERIDRPFRRFAEGFGRRRHVALDRDDQRRFLRGARLAGSARYEAQCERKDQSGAKNSV